MRMKTGNGRIRERGSRGGRPKIEGMSKERCKDPSAPLK